MNTATPLEALKSILAWTDNANMPPERLLLMIRNAARTTIDAEAKAYYAANPLGAPQGICHTEENP